MTYFVQDVALLFVVFFSCIYSGYLKNSYTHSDSHKFASNSLMIIIQNVLLLSAGHTWSILTTHPSREQRIQAGEDLHGPTRLRETFAPSPRARAARAARPAAHAAHAAHTAPTTTPRHTRLPGQISHLVISLCSKNNLHRTLYV